MASLYEYFDLSLRPGGFLYCETISGRGGNYLELPKAGELQHKLQRSFEFEVYKEKRTGPQSQDAVTVTLLGKKKTTAESLAFWVEEVIEAQQANYQEVTMPWELRKKRNPFSIKTIKSIKSIKPIKAVKPIKPIRPIKPIAPIGQEYYWRDK